MFSMCFLYDKTVAGHPIRNISVKHETSLPDGGVLFVHFKSVTQRKCFYKAN